MPRIDGFMLAEQIKQDPAIGSTVIMMLTSGDRPDDMARCDQLGIAAYLLKPVKQSELLEAIELALGITVPREELLRSAVAATASLPSLHVLLGGGQPRQSEAGGRAAGGARAHGHRGQQRQGSRRGNRRAEVRPGADGRADAGNGRAGGNGRRSAHGNNRPARTCRSSP